MAARNTTTVETNLYEAVQQFCAERGLSKESVLSIIKESLVTAYRKKLESILKNLWFLQN